ncbi:hypothetical protein KCP73_04790 [Salmonella enterica subsp. enterica]|nr:hypothetical protein KCP73_04790 [Salmonella enterica subsp. enterica]
MPGRYPQSVRAVNNPGTTGNPASIQFSISAPAACYRTHPAISRLQPHRVRRYTTRLVQYEFWFSDAQITDIHQVENAARCLGTALRTAASVNSRPGRDYWPLSGGKSGR